jgi:hypothetical protein
MDVHEPKQLRYFTVQSNLYTLPSELHEIKHAIQSLMQSSLSEIARNQAGPPVLYMADNESN